MVCGPIRTGLPGRNASATTGSAAPDVLAGAAADSLAGSVVTGSWAGYGALAWSLKPAWCPASAPGFTGRGTSVAVGSLRCPHPLQHRDTSRYSMTFGAGGGSTSTTWRRTRAVSSASCNDCSHRAHRSGATSKISFGSLTTRRDADAEPSCLPGLRPDRLRDERFFAGCLSPGASADGGRDDVEEFLPRRRSSSAIRSACSAITRLCCTTTDSSSRTRASNRSTNASNDPKSDTTRSCQGATSALVATRAINQLNSYSRCCQNSSP